MHVSHLTYSINLLFFLVDAVSKGGLRNLTRAMALELAEYGIRVNDVAPGMILTPMNQESIDDSKKRKEKEAQIPIKRAGIPEDIANMVLFLCSDDASYCTGASFFVDGGWMLTRPDV
jgi:glucose 1-dehydrogenase